MIHKFKKYCFSKTNEKSKSRLNSLQKVNYYFMLIMILFICSCNSQNHTKLSSNQESNRTTNESSINKQKSEPIKYGSGDVVFRGFLDKSGNMWFTTSREGVFRYDGTSFTNFTEKDGLCNNEVSAILEDKKGNIWFGTASGLCRYDGNSFTNIPVPKDEATSDWLERGYPIINPSSIMSMIQDRNGVFWLGTNGGGVYRYDGETFTSFLKNKGKLMPDSLHHNVITSIIEDKAGNIWFSSFSHGGITKYDGTTFTHYGVKDGLGDDMISTSYIDRSENLWFGTRSGGMSRFDGKKFITIHETEEPCQNNMASIHEDKTGKFWVASFARSGVCWYDGKSFRPTKIENSDKLNDIKFISEDNAGNIWFGGRYGLLWRYNGKVLEDFTYKKK